MRAYEFLFEDMNYSGTGWLNIKDGRYVSTPEVSHVATVFNKKEELDLTQDDLMNFPITAKILKNAKNPEKIRYDDITDDADEYAIVLWMNNKGWVRANAGGSIMLHGNSLKQVHKAARMITGRHTDRDLYIDYTDETGKLKGHWLQGAEVQHFMRHGNVNFPAHI